MDTYTMDAVPVPRSEVVSRPLLDGEAVLLHLDSGQYHGLNEVGAAIWTLLDGERDVATVTAELRRALDDPPADLDDVVRRFLDQLRGRDLLS